MKNKLPPALEIADLLDTCYGMGYPEEAAVILRKQHKELEAIKKQMITDNAVAWRWSEVRANGEPCWFSWTASWEHHDKAKSLGCEIQYAYYIGELINV
jgi:hypothetical protein